MISKIIKDFFLKRKVNKKLKNYQLPASTNKIIKVGVLLDATYFSDWKALLVELERFGIKSNDVEVLFFVNKKTKKSIEDSSACFFRKDISFGGLFKSETVTNFTSQSFDMLISYYDVQNPSLVLVTKSSKAKFKVGFQTIDKRINHVTIHSVVENYTEFISELFKYLKILNKI